jgi:hypothetical protein
LACRPSRRIDSFKSLAFSILTESYADPRTFAPNHVARKNLIFSDKDEGEIIRDNTLGINVQSRPAI